MISPETLTVRVVGSNLTSLVGYRLLMTLWWFTLWVLKYCQQNHYVGDFHYVSFWNGVFWVFRIFEDFIFFEAIMSRKIVIPPENHKSRKKSAADPTLGWLNLDILPIFRFKLHTFNYISFCEIFVKHSELNDSKPSSNAFNYGFWLKLLIKWMQ